MSGLKLTATIAMAVVAFGTAVAGGVVTGKTSSDEQALQATRQAADRGVEQRVNRLLAKMTLEEKLEQIQLLPDFLVTEEEVRAGLGSVLSVTDPARIRELQEIAVNESRLKIPLLFAFDTIHGFRTVFPIPLAVGASFDPRGRLRRRARTARASRPPSGSSRRTPPWSTSPTSPAGAGSPRARARTRT